MAIDTNLLVVMFYHDMQEALDRVPHMRLKHIVKAYGIDSTLVDWQRFHLIGRTQSVKIEQNVSTRTSVPSGVVKGSVL